MVTDNSTLSLLILDLWALDLGLVGMFNAIGKASMSPENEGIELLFQGPYLPREVVTKEEYPFKKKWRIHLMRLQQQRCETRVYG
jgi:hypothetical protein